MSDETLIKSPVWNEAERLKALQDFDILDTPFEEQFDEVTRIASQLCGAPVALISLVDAGRQWFKSAVGLEIRETPLEQSVCSHAILTDGLTVIPDTSEDERSSANTLVTQGPKFRFYAGAPLKTSKGLPLGMVCILDYKPRDLSPEQGKILTALARQVMLMLEMNAVTKAARKSAEETERALELSRSQNERLQLLFRINDHLIRGEAPNAILSEMFADLAKELEVDTYLHYVVTAVNSDRLVLQSSHGLGAKETHSYQALCIDPPVCGQVARQRESLVLADIMSQGDPALALFRDLGLQSYACHPLIADGALLGTLAFGSKSQKAFSADKIKLMKTICDQVSISLARCQLIDKLTAREADLNVLVDKAQAANVAKTEFLANMSHEIRTPMNAVVGLAHLLELSSPLTPKQHEFVSTLKLSAEALMGLINDMLDIAKIEARTVEFEAIEFDFGALVKEVMSISGFKAEEKRVAFSLRDDLPPPGTYLGDPMRIRQIILNLCTNAIKFTEKGGVSVSLSSAPLTEDTDLVTVKVEDTGIGIAHDKLGIIFQKFMQADASITRKYGGTGLGLAIIKTLTEAMGGDITASSLLGQGSVFTARLPLKRSQGTVQPLPLVEAEPSRIPAETGRFKVLLVEDYPANVMVATMFLESFGYGYSVANDGREALKKLEEETFGAILMDVQMHGMDGFQATKLIREGERRLGTPRKYIIGMTAHALASDRDKCLAAGMDDYLSKPFEPAEFEAKLRKVASEQARS